MYHKSKCLAGRVLCHFSLSLEIPVQVNGKTKAVISIPVDISKEDAIAKAKEVLGDKLSGNIIKEIYVPKKIVNIVAK